MRKGFEAGAIALATMLMAAPATADVKAGVDAWSRGEYRQAVEEWRGPAVAGDPDAQFNLGQAYKLGRGVPVDPALAESWFRKAALQGHELAVDNYGIALFQDDKKADAVPWLEKSVARGEPRTQLVLGTMLFNGDGIAKDVVRAYALMTRASSAGLESASQTLAQMDQYISPAEREKGTKLAAAYAAHDRALPPHVPLRPGSVDPDASPIPVAAAAAPTAPEPQPAKAKPEPRKPVHATTRTTAVAAKPGAAFAQPVVAAPKPAMSAPKPAAGGGWRVQLGAFRDQGNAQDQWATLRGRMSGAQPSYVKAGAVTRLIAGPYASRAEAARACSVARTACVVVAP